MTAEEQGIVKKPAVPGRRFIAIDLDGTLAEYDRFRGRDYIGAPVKRMVERVQQWLESGDIPCVFTSRVEDGDVETYALIHAWCERHIGERLYVTATKHRYFNEIWDDRARRVERNTGVEK